MNDTTKTLMNYTTKTLGLVGIVYALSLPGCSDPVDAVRAAQSAGWTKVSVTDSTFAFNQCGDGEMEYRISGLNPRGDQASAMVCCGHTNIKGCTIRY